MKTVNSVSGGKTSAYIAANYKADYNVFSLVCINHDASRIKDSQMNNYINDKLDKYIPVYGEFIATAEHDMTLYAIRDLEQFIGSEITWVRGKNFDDVIKSANTHGGCPTRLPSKMSRYCTDEMKMVPIFKWWFTNIGEKVKMRIGFRSDEFGRMERFYNGNPNHFKFPTYCKNYGNKQMHHENINWRTCHFDLVRDGVKNEHVKTFWEEKGFVGEGFFRRKIEFPIISNCCGCPFKDEETIAVMAEYEPTKIDWFSEQEDLGKGTWIKGTTYSEIIENRHDIAREKMVEYKYLLQNPYAGSFCDSGGCTD